MRRVRSETVGVWALAMSALCATAALASDEDRPLAFGPGEQSTYRVSFLGVGAGTAVITVGAPTERAGRSVWPIVSVASSDPLFMFFPVRDKFVSYWEPSSQRTVASELFAEENRKRRRQQISLDHAKRRAEVVKQKEGGPRETASYEIEAGTTDMASATFMLRNLPLEVGKSYEQKVFTGARSFTLRGTVEGLEQLEVGGVTREVFKVRVQTQFTGKLAAKRDLYAYFTTDEARVPVRVEADFSVGTLVAELTDYKGGRKIALREVAQTGSGGF